MSAQYNSWVHSQLEPDQIIPTRHKREKVIRLKNASKEELVEKFGDGTYMNNLKFDSLTDAEKAEANEKYLQQHGL